MSSGASEPSSTLLATTVENEGAGSFPSTSINFISNYVSSTHISDLPKEMILKLFSYLNIDDICFSVSYVCQFWKELAEDDLLWAKLKLVCVKDMTESKIYKYFYMCPKLKNITFQWRVDINEVLTNMKTYCLHVERIEIICCGMLKRASISLLVDRYKNLKYLRCAKCWKYEPQCFEDVWQFSKLESLDLSHCTLSGTALHRIADNCLLIKHINIDYIRNLKDEDMMYLLDKKKNTLLSLFIFGESLSDVTYLYFAKCEKLETLHISSCCLLTNTGLEGISKCSALTSLKLRHAVQIDNTGLRRFLGSRVVSKLKYLSLSRSASFDYLCACVIAKNCHFLEELDLMYCPGYNDDVRDEIVSGCKNLRVIYCGHYLDESYIVSRPSSEFAEGIKE